MQMVISSFRKRNECLDDRPFLLKQFRKIGFGAKKGGELGGGTDAGVMNSHDLPKFTTVRRIRRYAKVACCLSICPLNVTAGRCPARSAALLWHSRIGCV